MKNIKVINKKDKIEVFVDMESNIDPILENVRLLTDEISDISKWKSFESLEIGFIPACEYGECKPYSMPMEIMKKEIQDDLKEIKRYEVELERNKDVFKWMLFYKVELENNKPLRNIGLLIEKFGTKISEIDKDNIRKVMSGEKEIYEMTI